MPDNLNLNFHMKCQEYTTIPLQSDFEVEGENRRILFLEGVGLVQEKNLSAFFERQIQKKYHFFFFKTNSNYKQ